MRFFRNSDDFEFAIFNSARRSFRKYDNRRVVLNSIWPVVAVAPDHPDTFLGEALWRQIGNALKWRSADPTGLKFVSFVGTGVDFYHKTDGVVYWPATRLNFVTIDAFNILTKDLTALKSFWLDTFVGQVYSNLHFQSDLLRFKEGLAEYLDQAETLSGERLGWVNPLKQDFRQFALGKKGARWENHFVLTPKNVGNHEEICAFASMIAGYLLSLSGPTKNSPARQQKPDSK